MSLLAKAMVFHSITIKDGGVRYIQYLRPLTEYPSDDTEYCDAFDKLMQCAVKKVYPEAKPDPGKRVSTDWDVVQLVTEYRKLSPLPVNEGKPKATFRFVPLIVSLYDDVALSEGSTCPDVTADVIYGRGTSSINKNFTLECGWGDLEKITEVIGQKGYVSFREWIEPYLPIVARKYSEG